MMSDKEHGEYLSSLCLAFGYCPLALCLGFFFSSHFVIVAEVARVEVGSWGWDGKHVREACVSASRHQSRFRQGGSKLLPLRRVFGCTIEALRHPGMPCRQSR